MTEAPDLDGQSAIDVLDIDHPLAVMMGLNQLGELSIREDVDTTFHGGNYAGLASQCDCCWPSRLVEVLH